jgi:acetyltransferase-like isoleucine patch superfamily enzyme
MHALKQWLKQGDSPLARFGYQAAMAMLHAQLPPIPGVHRLLYRLYRFSCGLLDNLMRCLWWTPLLQSRLLARAPRLYLFGGLPAILGPLQIRLGSDCQLAGRTTLSGRTAASSPPQLIVGDHCVIGWGCSIAVGRKVVLGEHVKIAANCFLAGYPGHPLDAAERARNLPEHDEQVGDILLDDHVWLGTGVMVMSGVHIGVGTVVAAGSVVTRDLPAGVLAGGNPARVIRVLDAQGAVQ